MAELIVRMKGGEPTTTFEYELRSSQEEGAGPLEQEYVVEPSPALVRRLCDKIDSIVEGALGPTPVTADPAAQLAGTGQLLYDNLFPRLDGNIPELVRRLREVEGPLLVRTNESLVPWELLHDGTEFLGLAHDVGKRTFVTNRVVGGRTIRTIAKALIVGDPNGNLESARDEARWLAEWLGERGVECTLVLGEEATLLRVVGELVSGGYDLLHYCGHVAVPVGTKYVGLRLHRDELLDGRALTPVANTGAPPIVFINGCASADPLANLCVSFMVVGAKIVVGTRYPVAEEPARLFAERFYADLTAGSAAGAAIRSARRSLVRPTSVDWAAFVLYGDPSVRIATGDTVVKPVPEGDPRMDPGASAVLTRAVRRAAGRGVVTSMDLLAELLSTEEITSRATDAAGAEKLVLAEELLRTVLDIGPHATPLPDADVEFSDTVESVLGKAKQRTQESGRELTTTADLISAFLAVGGGSSSQVLELFDISLAELAGEEPARTEPAPRATERTRQPRPSSRRGGTNGDEPHRPVVSDLLFDRTGRLRSDRLAPRVVVAVRVAALLAAAQGTVISTSLLLYGLGVADSARLTDALRAQGDVGAAALDRLTLTRETQQDRFSSRTLRALENAATTSAAGVLDDSTLLAELLAEKTSSARATLGRLGVDADRLADGT